MSMKIVKGIAWSLALLWLVMLGTAFYQSRSARADEAPSCGIQQQASALVDLAKQAGKSTVEVKDVAKFMTLYGEALPEEGRSADRIIAVRVSEEGYNVGFFKDNCLIGILPGVSANEWDHIMKAVDGQEV